MDWWAIDETTSRKHSIADPVNGKTVHCSKAFVWALNSCFRLMVLLDLTTGLRRSELLAPRQETRKIRRTSPDRDAARTIDSELLDHPLAKIYRQSQ